MTKHEFITGYCERSDITEYQTDYGFNINGRKYHASPCACGEDVCQGWAMVSEDDLPTPISQEEMP